MSTIPGNSNVTVVVGDAQSAFAQGPSDVLTAVTAYLNALNGAYSVQNTSYSGGVMATLSPLLSEQFQATIVMESNYTLDSSDIYRDVQAAFNEVSGGAYTPNQITIPSYIPLPGSAAGVGTPVSTGQAAPTPTIAQTTANAGTGIADSITKTVAALGSAGQNLLIGLAAIVILAIVLIAYGPNIGKIASAA
jgi:hypothetical protein